MPKIVVNWTLTVQVIVENAVTCFLRHSEVSQIPYCASTVQHEIIN